MRLSLLIACLFIASCTSSADPDPTPTASRVDQYAVTTFQGAWDSLRTGQAVVTPYVGGPNDGKYTIPLPFDFPFDGEKVSAGTLLSVGANGALSFLDSAIPAKQVIGDSSYRGVIAPFNGDLKQGGDAKAGIPDTSGRYQVTGTAPNRVLTIEYRAFHLRGGGDGAGVVDTLTSMQVKLYETSGVIEFVYRDHGLDLPTKFAWRMCVGLNGLSASGFRSKAHITDTKIIPSTDLRWTPVLSD